MRDNRTNGFSLIEIALVLVIAGILMTGAMAGVKPVMDSSKTATTGSRMQRIELALLAYVMQNGCLPCPADGTLATSSTNAGWSFGNASGTDYYGPNGPSNRPCAGATATGCSAVRGVVPWNTLGLREADVADGWNDRISYAVVGALTVTAGSSMTRTEPVSYPAGSLIVENNAATPQTQTPAAAYVLVSHGRDRRYAYAAGTGGAVITAGQSSASQLLNSPAATGTTFRQDTPMLQEGASYFDDIVRYRTAPNIIIDCGPNACGNPA